MCMYRRVFVSPVFVDGAWFWATADTEMRVKEHETWNKKKRGTRHPQPWGDWLTHLCGVHAQDSNEGTMARDSS